MEAAGIEPASADAPVRTSTSVVRHWISPAGRRRTPYRRASHPLVSRFGRLALPPRRARSLAPLPESRAQLGAASLPNYLGSECELVVRTCVFAGGFTRPTGDLGLQLCRRTDHVETRSPPYVGCILAAPEETATRRRLDLNHANPKGSRMKLHRIAQLTVAGVAAAALAVPVAQAAANDRVQVAGAFVAPGQASETQRNAGHDPATRLAQIGGAVGGTPAGATSGSSSGIDTGGIAAIAVLGAFWMIVAASMVVSRHRRRLATATC